MEQPGRLPIQTDSLCRETLDGLRDLVAVLDQDGHVFYANRALCGHMGCPSGRCDRPDGDAVCEGCLVPTARRQAPAVPALVAHGGRLYELETDPLEDGFSRLAVWHDVTRREETSRLLHSQYSKMRRDILHARSVQSSLLPRKLLQVDGYCFDCLYKPCEEMSGDIFDMVRIGRDNVAFYVADVAGHGVTAAMLTVFFSTAIRLEMRHMDMPGEVLSRIHRRFVELNLEEQCYITAFLVKLELSTGRLYWSNAGHICPPVVVGPRGEPRELAMAGLPISRWFEDQAYHTDTCTLEEGESLLLFSDGLEARWNDMPLSEDMPRALAELMRTNRPTHTLEAIWHRVGAEQKNYETKDDTTLLLVSRLQSPADGR